MLARKPLGRAQLYDARSCLRMGMRVRLKANYDLLGVVAPELVDFCRR